MRSTCTNAYVGIFSSLKLEPCFLGLHIDFENGRYTILIEFGRDLNNEISKVLISVVQPLIDSDIYGSFNDQGTPLLLLQ